MPGNKSNNKQSPKMYRSQGSRIGDTGDRAKAVVNTVRQHSSNPSNARHGFLLPPKETLVTRDMKGKLFHIAPDKVNSAGRPIAVAISANAGKKLQKQLQMKELPKNAIVHHFGIVNRRNRNPSANAVKKGVTLPKRPAGPQLLRPLSFRSEAELWQKHREAQKAY